MVHGVRGDIRLRKTLHGLELGQVGVLALANDGLVLIVTRPNLAVAVGPEAIQRHALAVVKGIGEGREPRGDPVSPLLIRHEVITPQEERGDAHVYVVEDPDRCPRHSVKPDFGRGEPFEVGPGEVAGQLRQVAPLVAQPWLLPTRSVLSFAVDGRLVQERAGGGRELGEPRVLYLGPCVHESHVGSAAHLLQKLVVASAIGSPVHAYHSPVAVDLPAELRLQQVRGGPNYGAGLPILVDALPDCATCILVQRVPAALAESLGQQLAGSLP
mmetsp:Transcript_42271/g.120523  ORF Transcript_42271/g.120523 Transcript_42271/m.120523 type:complete len:271 (+) Transcript_42271:35-847(+)